MLATTGLRWRRASTRADPGRPAMLPGMGGRGSSVKGTRRWRSRGARAGLDSPLVSAPARRAPNDLLVHLRRARDHVDRHYAEPLDLETIAAVAGISKFHFQRLFTATYGVSPAAHLSRRRVERAQDLLRATNLTVTEVCHAVGFSSLGSFSSRFRELVGESPSEFQRRWAESGAPHIPGCFVLMWGLAERRSASQEKPPEAAGS
jgi:AraC-like DNA-binding protein